MELSKENSITIMKELIKKCDERIEEMGETAHITMPRIKKYHPFCYRKEKRTVASRATAMKSRLEKEIKRLEG